MQIDTLTRCAAAILAPAAAAAGAFAGPVHHEVNPAPVQTAAAKVGFIGQAYGSYVFNDKSTVISGPTAWSEVNCGAPPGTIRTNTDATIALPGGVGTIGAQSSHAEAIESGASRTTFTTSETNGISVLGGLITSGLISSSTRTTFDGSAFSSEQSTSIADLRVLGARVAVHPQPNTKIDLTLPLGGTIGYVEINRQVKGAVAGGYDATTTGLHIVLLPGTSVLPGGGLNLWIATARSALTPPISSALGGAGYATQVILANGVVRSGPTALAYVPCTGAENSNTVATAHLPDDIATTASATTTASGSTKGGIATVHVTNTIESVGALKGAISADVVKAVATATRSGDGPVALSDAGSQLAHLVVGGRAIDASVAPNTRISVLNGAAEITLHKVTRTSNLISVTMIEILIKDDTLGLPVGSIVQVGTAYASISPAS